MSNIIENIIEVSEFKTAMRDPFAVMCKLTEEAGETATEVGVHMKFLNPEKGGEDGVLGEVADVIITAVDLLWVIKQRNGETFDPQELMDKIDQKLAKWKSL